MLFPRVRLILTRPEVMCLIGTVTASWLPRDQQVYGVITPISNLNQLLAISIKLDDNRHVYPSSVRDPAVIRIQLPKACYKYSPIAFYFNKPSIVLKENINFKSPKYLNPFFFKYKTMILIIMFNVYNYSMPSFIFSQLHIDLVNIWVKTNN